MKRKYIIITICVIAFLIFMRFQLFRTLPDFFEKDGGIYFNKFDQEYLDLFSENAKRKFSDSSISLSRSRNSFGFLDYDSSYSIIIYKLKLSMQSSVSLMIKENYHGIDGTDYHTYNVADQSCFQLEFKPGKVDGISKLILTADDEGVKVIFKNDSSAYYYLPEGPFSVKYGADSVVDFFIKPKSTFNVEKKFPKSLLFLKRNNSLYFFMMAPLNEDKKISETLLYSLLKN